MADRPNHLQGYPVPTANFMNLAPQQPSMSFQQQQASMNSTQQIPGVRNPENQRLWQQMQDSHRAMGGVDGMRQQQLNPQQMADLFRNQSGLQQVQNHQPQHQQPPQLQQAQQFPNLAGIGPLNNSLPTQNALAAMQRQQGMQGSGIGGLPNSQLPPQMAQILAQRSGATNPAMIQMNRQLGLLNRAQKQQPQNGPTTFGQPGTPLGGQQNFGQMPFQASMFPTKSENGGIPATQGQQQFSLPTGLSNGLSQTHAFPNEMVQQAVNGGDGRPSLNINEMQMKVQQLRQAIEVDKRNLEAASKPPTAPDAIVALREKHREIQQKEAMLIRMFQQLRHLTNQGGASQPQQPGSHNGSEAAMGFHNQQQAGQQQLPPSQGWMQQAGGVNLPGHLASNGLPGNQQMHSGGSQNGTTPASQQQMNSPFHPNLVQSQQQQTPVPRSGPTPQQQQQQQQIVQAMLQQNGNHSSPPSSGSVGLPAQGNFGQHGSALEGQEVQHRPNGLSLPPMARERFMYMLQEWWKRSGINFNQQLITINNRTIDLHQLHTEVLQLGGAVNVKRHDLWNVIAAKMGWNPAAISETGRTQEQIANQFRIVYEKLLETFEQTYMAAAMKQSLTAPPQQATEQAGSNQAATAPNQPQSQQLSAQQAMHMIKLASMPVEQLRAQGYPENLIQNIERNRPTLEATWRRMQMQRLQAQSQQIPQQQLQQQGSHMNPPFTLPNQIPNQGVVHNSAPLLSQSNAMNANALGHPGVSAGSNQPSETTTQQHPQLSVQQQMLGVLATVRKPTQEASRQAMSQIEQMKQEIAKERTFRPEHVKHLTDAEKGAFTEQFDALCNSIRYVFGFLHLYYAATSDIQVVRGLVNLLDVCDKQRQLLHSQTPVYVLDIPALQRITKNALEARTKVVLVVQQLRFISQQEQNQARASIPQQSDGGPPHPPPPSQQGPSSANLAPSPASVPPRPPTAQSQTQQVPQQNLRPPPSRTPQIPPRPPSVTQGKAKSLAATSPSTGDADPSPSASTPLPSGATPSHVQTSPQTPKSPKTRAPARPRAKARRPSKAQPNVHAVSSAATASSAAMTGAGPTTSTPAVEPAPSPAQIASSPAETSLKRSRDEEVDGQAGSTGNEGTTQEGTPSKRAKTDWENAPDAGPSKHRTEVENIKTIDDAAKFYSDMTQVLELSNDMGLPPDVHETLTQLVKTVGKGIDVPDTSGSSSLSSLPNAGTSSPKATDGDDSFFKFLDFTAFQQEDEKADTPELANPSPESGAGSETDHPPTLASSGSTSDRTKIVDTSDSDPKIDFFDAGADSLRLGIWGEIDGGESGYFNSSDMWKWEGMPPASGDNSWAIST